MSPWRHGVCVPHEGLAVPEQVFKLNGIGKLFVESVLNNDYATTQSPVMIFVRVNFAVDAGYAWLAPRIRYN